MKLEYGKSYELRCGLLTEPMAQTTEDAFRFPFGAKVRGIWRTWQEAGNFLANRTDHQYDVIREVSVEPADALSVAANGDWQDKETVHVTEESDHVHNIQRENVNTEPFTFTERVGQTWCVGVGQVQVQSTTGGYLTLCWIERDPIGGMTRYTPVLRNELVDL